MASEFGLDETVIGQLKGDKDTYNKLRGLKDKMIELKDKKSNEDNAGKRAEYQKQIDDLNKTIASMKEANAKDISGLKSQHDAEITDLIIRANLMNKNYANKELKPEVNAITAKALVDMELASKGAIAMRDGHNIVLKQKSNPELDYYDNNVKVSYDDFVTKTLTNSKLLAVSDGKQHPTPPRTTQHGADLNIEAVQSAIAESMADLKIE